MKKILASLAILATSATLCMAQKTPVEKYELVPDGYMDVYLDLDKFTDYYLYQKIT